MVLGKFVAATYHLGGALKDEIRAPSFGCPQQDRERRVRPCAVPQLRNKHRQAPASGVRFVGFRGRAMFTNDLLKGKRILTPGAGTGIGRAMAERFLQLGATVYICGRRREVVEKTAAELSASTGGTIEGFACDVREPEGVEPLIEQLWAKGPLDVLVNN